jgi:hypothetical protein
MWQGAKSRNTQKITIEAAKQFSSSKRPCYRLVRVGGVCDLSRLDREQYGQAIVIFLSKSIALQKARRSCRG